MMTVFPLLRKFIGVPLGYNKSKVDLNSDDCVQTSVAQKFLIN